MPVAPDGTSWEVRRRWVRRPRWRDFNLFPDAPILDFDSPAGGLLLLALIAAFAVLASLDDRGDVQPRRSVDLGNSRVAEE